MKKLQVLVVAALLVGSASIATAQDPQPQPQPQPQGQGQGQAPGRAGNRGMAMLLQGITLTAEQQVQMDSINARTQAQRQAYMADQTLEGPARREKMMEMMNKQREEIKAVLTAEQKTVFEKNVAEMRARMQQQGGQRPPQR